MHEYLGVIYWGTNDLHRKKITKRPEKMQLSDVSHVTWEEEPTEKRELLQLLPESGCSPQILEANSYWKHYSVLN